MTTIAYFIQNYTIPANNRGYPGFRIKPEFSAGKNNILPKHPARPDDYVLALLYTHEGLVGYHDAREAAQAANEFPGQHTHIE